MPVVCERDPPVGDIEAILLLVTLPFNKQKRGEQPEPAAPESSDPPQEVVQFRITKVHQAYWDSLLNWAGGSAKVEVNGSIVENIVS